MIDDEEYALTSCFSEFFGSHSVEHLARYSDFPYRVYSPAQCYGSIGERLTVYHFHINATGNVDVGNLTTAAIIEQDLNYVLLVGCAGGRAPKLCHFDLVIPADVYFYELGKLKAGRFSSYNRNIQPDAKLRNWARTVSMDRNWLQRLPREFKTFTNVPKVDFGMLAAGDKVVTDSGHQVWSDILKHAPKTVATEMESYGCLKAAYETGIPALTIRGISDLLDDKDQDSAKDEGNKRVAAAVAATFATALLAHIRGPISKRSRATLVIGDLDLDDAEHVTEVLKAIFGDRLVPTIITRGSLRMELEGDHDAVRALAFMVGAELLPEVSRKISIDAHGIDGAEEARSLGTQVRLRMLQNAKRFVPVTSEYYGMLERSGLFADDEVKDEIARRIYAEAETSQSRGRREVASSRRRSEAQYTEYYRRVERVCGSIQSMKLRANYIRALSMAFDARYHEPPGPIDIARQFGLSPHRLPEYRLVLNKRQASQFFREGLVLVGRDYQDVGHITRGDYEQRFNRAPIVKGRSSYWFTLAEWTILLELDIQFPLPEGIYAMAKEAGVSDLI